MVVTGAGRGIGREHALLFGREGATVVVNDLGGAGDGEGSSDGPAYAIAAEIVDRGGRAVADTSDVSVASGADTLIATAVEEFGRLDVLVNNAGILRDRAIVNMTDDDWTTSIRVNLTGHFFPIRAAARHWRATAKAGSDVVGSIVNTSSESGLFANAGQANYDAAKSGVATLTEVAAKELSRYGVRTNAILPRARTRLTEQLVPPPRTGRFDKWEPANVSPFVAYLASVDCKINGQVFLVGGGLVQRAAAWSLDPDWVLESDERWTVESLEAAVAAAGPPEHVARLTGNIR